MAEKNISNPSFMLASDTPLVSFIVCEIVKFGCLIYILHAGFYWRLAKQANCTSYST